MPVLDVFNTDAFSVVSLTDAINKVPHVPGRAGQVVDWNEQGVITTAIMVEEVDKELRLVNPTPRGGPGQTSGKDKRKARSLLIPHYQHDDAVYADEVQGVRAFGSESQVQTLQGVVNGRLADHVQLKLDPTLEHQRIGAIKGIILDGDGTTRYDLFAEFGVSQPAEVDFALSNAATDVRGKCTAVVRAIAKALGGVPMSGVYCFASDSFWDALIGHKQVRDTYLNQQEAAQLRQGAAYQTLSYGGITFENYRGAVGESPFIADGKAHFFPVGTPGLFRTVYAPADYIETVNTIGLPRYAKQFRMSNDKGITLESQMNALSYCTRPNALQRAKAS